MKIFSKISIMAAAAGAVVTLATGLVSLVACGPRGGGEIPVLDVTASYPTRNIILQDIAEVEYIPLETREGFLIDNFLNVKFLDDQIVVATNRAGDIMTFDRQTGRALSSFNRTGRGPGEYLMAGYVVVDKRAGEMYVSTSSYTPTRYPLLVFDMAGRHLRTLELPGPAYTSELLDYDAEHILGYDPIPYLEDVAVNDRPYALISKRDTVVTPLPVRLAGRQTMMISLRSGDMVYVTGSNESTTTRSGDGYVFSAPGVDTMYRWTPTSGELTPVMVRRPAFASMNSPIALYFTGESSNHIFVRTVERRYDFDTQTGMETVNLIYDKSRGEFFEGGVVNGDFADERSFDLRVVAGVPGGTFVVALQAFELVDLHAEGKLTGRLAEIAAGLKEDDNPVMMIATFK